MKKVILASVISAITCFSANASDGGVYMETSNVYSGTSVYTNAQTAITTTTPRTSAHRVVVGHRPCGCKRKVVAPAPVAVKTHTEVIDHYQIYQPVLHYVPAGTYTTRRMVATIHPCNM